MVVKRILKAFYVISYLYPYNVFSVQLFYIHYLLTTSQMKKGGKLRIVLILQKRKQDRSGDSYQVKPSDRQIKVTDNNTTSSAS